MHTLRGTLNVLLAWHILMGAHAFRQTNIAGSSAQAKITRERTAVAKSQTAATAASSVRKSAAANARPKTSSGSIHADATHSAKHEALPVRKFSFAEIAHLVTSKTSSAGSGVQLAIVFALGMLASFICFWLFSPYLFAHMPGQSVPLAPCQPLDAAGNEDGAEKRASVTSDASDASQRRIVKKKTTVTFSPSIDADQGFVPEESARGSAPKKNTRQACPYALVDAAARPGGDEAAGIPGPSTADGADDDSQEGASAPNAEARKSQSAVKGIESIKSHGDPYPEGAEQVGDSFISFTLSSGSERRPYRQHLLTQGSEIATFCAGNDAFGYQDTMATQAMVSSSSDEGERGTASTSSNPSAFRKPRSDAQNRPPKPPRDSTSSNDNSKPG